MANTLSGIGKTFPKQEKEHNQRQIEIQKFRAPTTDLPLYNATYGSHLFNPSN